VSLTCSDIASLVAAESSRDTFAPGRGNSWHPWRTAVSGAVTGAVATIGSTVSAGGTTAASTGGAVTAAVTGVAGAALG
jgi:hypothetical protein